MIEGFEEYTHELTDYEKDILLPVMIYGLKSHVGSEDSVTSTEIVRKLKEQGYDIWPQITCRQ